MPAAVAGHPQAVSEVPAAVERHPMALVALVALVVEEPVEPVAWAPQQPLQCQHPASLAA